MIIFFFASQNGEVVGAQRRLTLQHIACTLREQPLSNAMRIHTQYIVFF
jgi:hypothetical protein